MAIYGRFGDVVTIVRKATIADVHALDGRKPDKVDRDAVKAGSYVVVRCDDGKDKLYHLAFLRADDGAVEITRAIDGAAALDKAWKSDTRASHGIARRKVRS